MQSWTIGFLCFNEEASIIHVLSHAYNVLPQITDNYEVLVVNDGSTDNSLLLIEEYKREFQPNLKIISHEKNKGIGESLISAYEMASNENVLVTCGDGQFDIEQIEPYKMIDEKTIICFYRINNTTYGIKRNYLSAINKYLNKYLLGLDLKDVNWSKVYKLDELKKVKFEVRSSLVETEICTKLKELGNNFIEVESKYLDRLGGVSKGASFKIVISAVSDILKLLYVILKFKMSR